MNRGSVALCAVLVLAGVTTSLAGWEEVGIDVSTPAKLETEPGERLLVAKVRANDHERIDIGAEITRWLRREIGRGTPLSVLDVPPPELPEQRPEVMAVNDVFFRRLGQQFRADLIVAAVAELRVEDRSGFVSRDVESPITGQTIRTSQFVERKGYRLKIDVFFLKGDNGVLLFKDNWQEDRIVESQGAEDLQTLFELLELMKDDLLAVLKPVKIREPRFIWVD
ncbi:MAG: hypothetical protein U0V87_03445 [Acidobacteriota bacterium]